MDNYEINILRRGGNWKKVKPDDLMIDEIDNQQQQNKKINNQNTNYNFLSYIKKVNSIILKLETLESEKNKLKDELKIYEEEFIKERKNAEDKINEISQEKEMIEKTINIIKNLKNL